MVIWDELPNADVSDINVAHELLCSIMSAPTSTPFGGKTVLGLGDFRQIAPVVPGGCQAEIEAASLKSHKALWRQARVHRLTEQIRAAEDEAHAMFVRRVGNGMEKKEDMVLHGELHTQISPLLRSYNTHFDQEEACSAVWTPQVLHDIAQDPACAQQLHQRAVLSMRTKDVASINKQVLQQAPGQAATFLSSTRVDTIDSNPELKAKSRGPHRSRLESGLSDERWLQGLQDNSVPSHTLELKPGCLCFLMRNLSVDEKAMNNSKVQIVTVERQRSTSSQRKVYLAIRILATGNLFYLGRMTFYFTTECGTRVCRKQYPLRLAYGMTVNRSQGQTLDFVCLDLRVPPFSHGQLYVALSRVRKKSRLIVLTIPEYARLVDARRNTNRHDSRKRQNLGAGQAGSKYQYQACTYNVVYKRLLA